MRTPILVVALLAAACGDAADDGAGGTGGAGDGGDGAAGSGGTDEPRCTDNIVTHVPNDTLVMFDDDIVRLFSAESQSSELSDDNMVLIMVQHGVGVTGTVDMVDPRDTGALAEVAVLAQRSDGVWFLAIGGRYEQGALDAREGGTYNATLTDLDLVEVTLEPNGNLVVTASPEEGCLEDPVTYVDTDIFRFPCAMLQMSIGELACNPSDETQIIQCETGELLDVNTASNMGKLTVAQQCGVGAACSDAGGTPQCQ